MSNIFRKSYTLPIPTGAEMLSVKGVPSARFKRKGKTITAPLTEKGDRVRVQSPFYYGTVNGKPVRLLVGAYTGFRAGELASVTPESFDLDADPPTLTVQATYSKRRRTDVQPCVPIWRRCSTITCKENRLLSQFGRAVGGGMVRP